ncbi:MAG: DUF5684 domain-containing protein [Terriglobia bacterium]
MSIPALAWLALQQEVPEEVGIVFGLVFLVIYLFCAFCFVKIAQKTNTEPAWWGWIPILQALLLLKVAGKPMWWIILLFIPIVSIIIGIIVSLGVAEARGKSVVWGVLLVLLPIIALPYLAFSE